MGRFVETYIDYDLRHYVGRSLFDFDTRQFLLFGLFSRSAARAIASRHTF